jgi:hypothetical protein
MAASAERNIRMPDLGIQGAGVDPQSMPYRIAPLVQALPDWMIGAGYRVASYMAVACPTILAIIAETPWSLLVTIVGGFIGIYIAYVNRDAVRARDHQKMVEREAKIIALESEVRLLDSRLRELSGSGSRPA